MVKSKYDNQRKRETKIKQNVYVYYKENQENSLIRLIMTSFVP